MRETICSVAAFVLLLSVAHATSSRAQEKPDWPTDEQIVTRWQKFFDGKPGYQKKIAEGYSYEIRPKECQLRREMLVCTSDFQITDPDGSVDTVQIIDLWRRTEDGWGPW